MARGIAVGILFWASACFAVDAGVGVFGGAALPTGKMATWENSLGELGENPLTGSDLGLSPKFGGKFVMNVLPPLDVEAADLKSRFGEFDGQRQSNIAQADDGYPTFFVLNSPNDFRKL